MWICAISWVIYTVGLLPLGLVRFIVYKKFLKQKPERKLLKDNWERDVVYLCGFPFVPSVRTISPFALKLETWLRLTGIKYENVLTMRFSTKGQIPFIEFNGEEFADSNLIIEMLKKYFYKDPDSQVDEKGLAVGHIVTTMMENYTAHTGFHYRYGYNMEAFISTLDVGRYYHNEKGIGWWKMVQPYLTRFRSYLQGMGRHENEVIWDFARQDLKAISVLLGANDYMLGGPAPTTVDCMLFGHLAQFLYIDIGFPQKACLNEECKNLVMLVEKIKASYYPDWDEVTPESNKKLMLPKKL